MLKGAASISNYDVPGTDPFGATATFTPGGTKSCTISRTRCRPNERYDYVFDGNAQTLDHMLVTGVSRPARSSTSCASTRSSPTRPATTIRWWRPSRLWWGRTATTSSMARRATT